MDDVIKVHDIEMINKRNKRWEKQIELETRRRIETYESQMRVVC